MEPPNRCRICNKLLNERTRHGVLRQICGPVNGQWSKCMKEWVRRRNRIASDNRQKYKDAA